jgi:hypothetical protein
MVGTRGSHMEVESPFLPLQGISGVVLLYPSRQTMNAPAQQILVVIGVILPSCDVFQPAQVCSPPGPSGSRCPSATGFVGPGLIRRSRKQIPAKPANQHPEYRHARKRSDHELPHQIRWHRAVTNNGRNPGQMRRRNHNYPGNSLRPGSSRDQPQPGRST